MHTLIFKMYLHFVWLTFSLRIFLRFEDWSAKICFKQDLNDLRTTKRNISIYLICVLQSFSSGCCHDGIRVKILQAFDIVKTRGSTSKILEVFITILLGLDLAILTFCCYKKIIFLIDKVCHLMSFSLIFEEN
jgi:hypothetical protein